MRALEAERALGRVAVGQKAVLSALAASMLVNMGTVFRWVGAVMMCGWVGADFRVGMGSLAAARSVLCSPTASRRASHHPRQAITHHRPCPAPPPPPPHPTAPPLPTACSVSAMATAASVSFGGAALCGLLTLASLLKVKGLEKKEAQLTGAA